MDLTLCTLADCRTEVASHEYCCVLPSAPVSLWFGKISRDVGVLHRRGDELEQHWLVGQDEAQGREPKMKCTWTINNHQTQR